MDVFQPTYETLRACAFGELVGDEAPSAVLARQLKAVLTAKGGIYEGGWPAGWLPEATALPVSSERPLPTPEPKPFAARCFANGYLLGLGLNGVAQTLKTSVTNATEARRRSLRHVRLWEDAPSATYPQEPVLAALAGPTIASPVPVGCYTPEQFATFSAGTYRARLRGTLWSRSNVTPLTLQVAVAVNGVPAVTWSFVRPVPLPTTPPTPPNSVWVEVDTDDPLVLAAPGAITLVNAGTQLQLLDAVFEVLPS
jgi:hypothetical protein